MTEERAMSNVIEVEFPRKPADNQCAACGGKLEHVTRIGRRLVQHCGCRATKRTIGAEMRPVEAK